MVRSMWNSHILSSITHLHNAINYEKLEIAISLVFYLTKKWKQMESINITFSKCLQALAIWKKIYKCYTYWTISIFTSSISSLSCKAVFRARFHQIVVKWLLVSAQSNMVSQLRWGVQNLMYVCIWFVQMVNFGHF